jgi:1-aminocyclopropane-1-carboxylate deaminase/D-cysteine desulfhydrase-like pyridoxal-dependent ACC family enzyme
MIVSPKIDEKIAHYNKKIYELTPVEKHKGIYFKRDDYFMPFQGNNKYDLLNGGKVRQCLSLFIQKQKEIKNKFNNTVSTATSIHSPQGTIISRVAKEFNFKSVIGIGNTTVESAVKKCLPITMCADLGSEIVLLSDTQAFNTVLYSKLKQLSEEIPMFIVMFGVNFSDCRESIIDSVAYQVKNIPDCIDTLVVPVGSGISFASVVVGIYTYKKKIKRIIAVQPFGYDRKNTIRNILSKNPKRFFYNFEYYISNYAYHKKLNLNVGFDLDNIYESKGFEMMINDNIINEKKENVCYWIVGNNNITRH